MAPVHPVLDRLERWGYVTGRAPNAEQACREGVNLPTDPTLSDSEVGRILRLLGQQTDLIT